jgi:hypothetical protein
MLEMYLTCLRDWSLLLLGHQKLAGEYHLFLNLELEVNAGNRNVAYNLPVNHRRSNHETFGG